MIDKFTHVSSSRLDDFSMIRHLVSIYVVVDIWHCKSPSKYVPSILHVIIESLMKLLSI